VTVVPLLERLMLKVEIIPAGCWIYTGGTNGRGYGLMGRSRPRKTVYVHRLMYEWAKGPLPKGCEVAHTCDVRNCVRPSHLVAMTHDGNVADMVFKKRQSRGETSGLNKVMEADVRDIRRRVAEGERRKDLANEYGLCVASIDNIITRKRWAHVH
jgi:hypothetical protein